MATQAENYCLSPDEQSQTRSIGINQVIAEQVGVDPDKVDVKSAKNGKDIFKTAIYGYMDIGATWEDGDSFHWHSYRFNGNNELPFSEDQLVVIGAMACARATEVRDFSNIDRIITNSEATVHELTFGAEATEPPQQTATKAA